MKMNVRRGLSLAFLLVAVLGVGWVALPRKAAAVNESGKQAVVLLGRTVPVPDHVAMLAPQTLQPVAAVRVALGDRVKKGQIVIEQDKDEDQATVRLKEAALDEARAKRAEYETKLHESKQDQALAAVEKAHIAAEAARTRLEHIEPAYRSGAVPERTFRDAQAAYSRAQQNERVARGTLRALVGPAILWRLDQLASQVREAQAALDNARANQDNNTLRARIAGTIVRLDVQPGAVGRPGRAVWGQVVDLRVLDVRCEATAAQAERVQIGEEAEVRNEAVEQPALQGHVVAIGGAADPRTGLLPLLIRIPNPHERLRCYLPVKVTLQNPDKKKPATKHGS